MFWVGYCQSMKRITYSGGSIVTGNAITAALLQYTTTVADAENSVTVNIPVLEENGEVAVHEFLLSQASQFDVADVGGVSAEEEAKRFPVPEMPQVGIHGTVEEGGDAGRTADDFNAVMNDIDAGLGE
jgi:hypothetical protein